MAGRVISGFITQNKLIGGSLSHWLIFFGIFLRAPLHYFCHGMSKQLFNTQDESFSFEVNGVTLTCLRLDIPKHVAYYIKFSSARKPITIARAKFVDSKVRWTSIPEGRQKEAEGVGQLIDQYLSRKD